MIPAAIVCDNEHIASALPRTQSTVLSEHDNPHVSSTSLLSRLLTAPRRLQAWLRANHRGHLARGQIWGARAIIWVSAVGVGLAAVVFATLTEDATRLFTENATAHPWLPFILTPAAAVGLLWLTRRYFAGAEGSGIPQVIAEMERPHNLPWRPLISLRIAAGKLLLGVTAVGAGFSFGREGPTVQIGACLMASIARFLPAGLQLNRRHLVVAGGAAGLAAAFNAPLAGIIFAIEELSRGIESRMSGIIITAIVLSGVVAQAWLGNRNYFGQVTVIGEASEIVESIIVCAIVTGLAGGLFARMLLMSAGGWRGRVGDFKRDHPYRFAAACGLLIAAIGWASGGLSWCGGYDETRALLEGRDPLPWFFGPGKFIATVVSYMTGLPGGIFAPSLAIGAGLGQDLVPLLWQNAFPTTIIVLCMVGFLAAATQAPITSFIIVMEMVDGYSLVIGMMATALIASGISRAVSRPLYPTLAEMMIARQRTTAAPPEPPSGPAPETPPDPPSDKALAAAPPGPASPTT